MKPQEYLMNEMFDKRCALGISQEEMASKLEISTRQYSNLETGKSLCSMKTLAMFLNTAVWIKTNSSAVWWRRLKNLNNTMPLSQTR